MHHISCTVKDESSLFLTVLRVEAVFVQQDLKIDWKGVHHQASASDSDAYIESPQKSQNLSPKISIKPSSSWSCTDTQGKLGSSCETLKGHTKSPQCYSFHRVIIGHPGLAGVGSNLVLVWYNFKYKCFKMTLLKFTWMMTTLLPDRGKLKKPQVSIFVFIYNSLW